MHIEIFFIISTFIPGVPVKFDDESMKESLLETLETVHNHHVLHGDIDDEENLILAPDNKIYLIGFGFSRITKNARELEREFLYTNRVK